jgi:hypothetical protein
MKDKEKEVEILEVVKARPVPTGYWKESDKWAILRILRESADYIAAIRLKEGGLFPLNKTELIGKTISIKGDVFVVRPDGVVSRVHGDVTT